MRNVEELLIPPPTQQKNLVNGIEEPVVSPFEKKY
jgi:hypothetical protein